MCVIELGGTIGDIESMPFVEALRQFQFRVGRESICLIHVSLLPSIHGEAKTKPTQHSVRELRALGLMPDLIMCRSTTALESGTQHKVASFCHVPPASVIGVHDVPSLYTVPILLRKQDVDRIVLERLGLPFHHNTATNGLRYWVDMEARDALLQSRDVSFLRKHEGPSTVRIALVGKYTKQKDAYHSVTKALAHAALAVERCLEIIWVEATDLEPGTPEEEFKTAWAKVRASDGILIPGGFGERGTRRWGPFFSPSLMRCQESRA